MKDKRASQSMLEYALFIAVIVAALFAMKTFGLRSVQEKYRQNADVFGEGSQFDKTATSASDSSTSTGIEEPPPIDVDACASVISQVDALENQLDDLEEQLEQIIEFCNGGAADELEEELRRLKEESIPALKNGIAYSEGMESYYRSLETYYRDQAKAKRAEAKAKDDYADWLEDNCPYYYDYDDNCEAEIASLRVAAAQLRAEADQLDAIADFYKEEADTWKLIADQQKQALAILEARVIAIENLLAGIGGDADSMIQALEDQIAALQQQIDALKSGSPSCF